MKLLQNSLFDSVSAALSTQRDNINIKCNLESYSCKMTAKDKKYYKDLLPHGQQATSIEALSRSEAEIQQILNGLTSNSFYSNTRGSNITESLPPLVTRKTLFYLKSALNISFPDYNFHQVRSEEFSYEPSLSWVVENVNSNMSTLLGAAFARQASYFWKCIDDEIRLNDCSIYSYHPDLESGPFAEEGSLWSFNHFFFNKSMKRIVFFKCNGTRVCDENNNYVHN